MGGKKKNKPNSFSNFRIARKPFMMKTYGPNLSNDELNHYIGAEWQKMSAEEKNKYAEVRKHILVDTHGIPLSEHDEAEERKLKIREDMVAGISNMINLHITSETMRELGVVVVAVNKYITTDEGNVFPAEVSLVRLTLGGGLDPKQYHAIINPPTNWPAGYASTLRNYVDSTHCLPTDRGSPDCVGTDSLDQVAAGMVAFLKQTDRSDRLCPVFTLDEKIAITKTVFNESFGMDCVDVWCLEHLLQSAFKALYPQHVALYTKTRARDDLVNSSHLSEYHPLLGCKWHKEERPGEVNQCSLNMAQRWGFLFIHALDVKATLGVKLVVGRHFAGPNTNRGEVIDISAQHKKKNIRRRCASLQTIDTASQDFYSDSETGSAAGSTASGSRNGATGSAASGSRNGATGSAASGSRNGATGSAAPVPERAIYKKTWCGGIGPETPLLLSSAEFPAMSSSRKQPSTKSDSRRQRKSLHPPSKRSTGAISIQNAAACLVANDTEDGGGGQEGAIVRSRGVGPLSPRLEEKLREMDLNDEACCVAQGLQRTQVPTAELVEPSSEPYGRGRKMN